MKRHTAKYFSVLTLGAALILSACQASGASLAATSGTAASPIFRGAAARADEYPEVGRLSTPCGSCTGTLILPSVVLTAAHCISYTGDQWDAGTFELDFEGVHHSHSVAQFVVDPLYFHCDPSWPGGGASAAMRQACRAAEVELGVGAEWALVRNKAFNAIMRRDKDFDFHDVALAFLDHPVGQVLPAALWHDDPQAIVPREQVELVGFGQNVPRFSARAKHWGVAELWSANDAILQLNSYAEWGPQPAVANLMSGDSGGPLFVSYVNLAGDWQRLQVGIAMSGSNFCGQYVRVDAAYPWIDGVLRDRGMK